MDACVGVPGFLDQLALQVNDEPLEPLVATGGSLIEGTALRDGEVTLQEWSSRASAICLVAQTDQVEALGPVVALDDDYEAGQERVVLSAFDDLSRVLCRPPSTCAPSACPRQARSAHGR